MKATRAGDPGDDALIEAAERLTLDELVAARKIVGYGDARGNAISGFADLFNQPLFYVKNPRGGLAEAKTQHFAYESLRAMSPEK